ncbi:MAG: glycoside hydrolase family 25 protein [Acidimicrobiales bacterium]
MTTASRYHRSMLGVAVLVVSMVALVAPVGAITGVDVASYQHPGGAPIDWAQVKAAGHSFAYVKATEATTYTNPYFASDWAGIARAGLYRGAYHYARPALPLSTAQAQARYFVSRTGSMGGPLDLPPMFDLEETGGLSPSDLVAWSLTWLQEVEALTGRRPVVYTGYFFWKDQLASTSALAGYRLWLPSYTSRDTPTYVPGVWGTWTFWQYSSTGRVPGIVGDVDVNRFCCAASNLAAMAGPSSGVAVGNPFGSLDGVSSAPGTLTVSGWAIDPDTVGPIDVHLYVDGRWGGAVTADGARPDVGAAYPGFGANHGFRATIPVGPGSHEVCAYAINTGSGTTNPLLGCRTVAPNPVGSIDRVSSPASGALRVSGWAADPDTTDPIDVHLYVDGRWTSATRADLPRPDVQTVLAWSGSSHGWAFEIGAVPGGGHEVCVYAINVGAGDTNPLLGCRSVVVLDGVPVGSLDGVATGVGAVTVSGWALDPETAGPITVQVFVDSQLRASLTADRSRPDVAAVFPSHGPDHGYRGELTGVSGGPHEVCVRALNVLGGAGDQWLGCRRVTVLGDPIGNLEAVEATDGVRVVGWALDPDTTAPIAVHVYVNGRWAGSATADRNRPDVGAVFGYYGPLHGFDVKVPPTADGTHRVCVYGINLGFGGNAPVGCRTFTVNRSPFGNVDAATRVGDLVRFQGWVIDPDTTAPIAVHAYVNGAWGGAFSADVPRPDVAAVYPEAGPNHGFDLAIPVGSGARQVCLYAINVGLGATNPLLGCRTL